MTKQIKVALAIGAAGAISLGSAGATLVSTTGAGGIISAPAFAEDDMTTNTHQQGFDERQNFLLTDPLAVDSGSIAAGTVVDSHMIFLNSAGGRIDDENVTWTFSGTILGVMSDSRGTLEAASNLAPFELGAAGTSYEAPFNARGLESNDGYSVSGNQITVTMRVTQPGDWIRVVTASVPDASNTGLLMLLPILGLFGYRLRRQRQS